MIALNYQRLTNAGTDPDGSHNLDIIASGSMSITIPSITFWDVFDALLASVRVFNEGCA